MGADANGKLSAIVQDYVNHTSILDDYDEGCGEATGFLYSCPNVLVTGGLARRNIGTPTSMRGPGAVPGLYALESAMDELACKLKIDPIQLRLLNEPEKDEIERSAFFFPSSEGMPHRGRGQVRLGQTECRDRIHEECRWA